VAAPLGGVGAVGRRREVWGGEYPPEFVLFSPLRTPELGTWESVSNDEGRQPTMVWQPDVWDKALRSTQLTQPAPVGARDPRGRRAGVLWRAPAGRGAPEGAIVRWCGTRSRAAVTL
jgi:hypothetical protein